MSNNFMDEAPPLFNNDELLVRMAYKIGKSISQNSFLMPPHVEKYEGFGEIIGLGSDIEGFELFDSVVFIDYSDIMWPDTVVTTVDKIMKVPKDFDPVEASRIYKYSFTAYRLLTDFGDHKVLVQNAAESVTGRAIIRLAKLLEIQTICIITANTNAKLDKSELMQSGATFVYTEVEFQSKEIIEFVKDLKPTLCLDAIGGNILNTMSHCLDLNSNIVTYAANNLNRISISPFLLISLNITIHGFWLPLWVNQNSYKTKIDMILHLEMLWLMNF